MRYRPVGINFRPGQIIDQFDTSRYVKKILSSHELFLAFSFINNGAINPSQSTYGQKSDHYFAHSTWLHSEKCLLALFIRRTTNAMILTLVPGWYWLTLTVWYNFLPKYCIDVQVINNYNLFFERCIFYSHLIEELKKNQPSSFSLIIHHNFFSSKLLIELSELSQIIDVTTDWNLTWVITYSWRDSWLIYEFIHGLQLT